MQENMNIFYIWANIHCLHYTLLSLDFLVLVVILMVCNSSRILLDRKFDNISSSLKNKAMLLIHLTIVNSNIYCAVK